MSVLKQDIIRTVVGSSPDIYLSLTDNSTPDRPPLDLTLPDRSVSLRVRKVSSPPESVVAINCTLLPGQFDARGCLNISGVLSTPGKGGRAVAPCTPSTFPTAGVYRAEVVVSYGAGKTVSVYETIRIEVRESL